MVLRLESRKMVRAINKKDNAGVFIPPPFIYVAVYFVAVFMQQIVPLDRTFFYSPIAANLAIVFILCSVGFFLPAFIQFVRSKNSLVPIKPTRSLETRGIYSISRNPMYMGLLLLYVGIAIVKGSWWSFILMPLLILIVQAFIIKKEEAYLERAFGEEYNNYRKRVRRWI